MTTRLNYRQGTGRTLRETYQELSKSGVPTPLTNIPVIEEYLKPISSLFWDMLLYKADHYSFMTLDVIKTYMDIFEIKIHPYIIRLICTMDRKRTMTLNELHLAGNAI